MKNFGMKMKKMNKEILKRYRDMKRRGVTTNWIVEKRVHVNGYLEALRWVLGYTPKDTKVLEKLEEE